MAKTFRKRFTFEGKRYAVYGDTEQEAIINATLKKKEMEDGKLLRETSLNVKAWSEEVMELHKSHITGNNLRKYQSRINSCIIANIGTHSLKSIRPSQLQKVMNLQSGKSKTQINEVYYYLKLLFSSAYEDGLINSDPSLSLKKPKKSEPKKRRALTEEECEALEKALPTDSRFLIFALMYYAGLRPSEAQRVELKDIKEDRLHVRGTKTTSATRVIPVVNKLKELLPDKMDGVIVRGTYGKPLKYYEKAWNNLIDILIDNGIKTTDDLSAYCLRHTFCTHLQEKGVDIRTAQYLMGHSNIQMTADIYTHTRESELQKVAKLIE